MCLMSKVACAGIAFTLVTTAMLVQGLPRTAAGFDSNEEGVTAAHQSEIKKMQETLRNKGHYRGKIDGVIGLRTRASIRAYQRAENLPITGLADFRTANGLGVRSEPPRGNSNGERRNAGQRSDGDSSEIKKGKPSAGIRRAVGRTNTPLQKQASKAAVTEDNRQGRH